MSGIDDYAKHQHRQQSAVAHEIGVLGDVAAGASPKFLRVGLNSVMADHAGLAELLISKGIISKDEYMDAMVEAQDREADRAVQRTKDRCGLPNNTIFG